mmetsp:Transcript_5186/g.15516  ORF Transcript_5186/g.15516 Transcript_5186/m.15516 type:complete len:319 (-) Transcript_5186:879-1835(-)
MLHCLHASRQVRDRLSVGLQASVLGLPPPWQLCRAREHQESKHRHPRKDDHVHAEHDLPFSRLADVPQVLAGSEQKQHLLRADRKCGSSKPGVEEEVGDEPSCVQDEGCKSNLFGPHRVIEAVFQVPLRVQESTDDRGSQDPLNQCCDDAHDEHLREPAAELKVAPQSVYDRRERHEVGRRPEHCKGHDVPGDINAKYEDLSPVKPVQVHPLGAVRRVRSIGMDDTPGEEVQHHDERDHPRMLDRLHIGIKHHPDCNGVVLQESGDGVNREEKETDCKYVQHDPDLLALNVAPRADGHEVAVHTGHCQRDQKNEDGHR